MLTFSIIMYVLIGFGASAGVYKDSEDGWNSLFAGIFWPIIIGVNLTN